MKQIPLIIDTDPGIDDAVAIALAVFNPRFDVRLITTVAGKSALKRQRRTRSS
jgi:non-specific riboncleoside hydrolase